MTDVSGPRRQVIERIVCAGCPSLKTEYWKDYLENDETDSGTSAHCLAADKNITAYWNRSVLTPSWCPFRENVQEMT